MVWFYKNMSSLSGNKISHANNRLRLLLIILIGMIGFAGVVWWRAYLFMGTEYVEVVHNNPARKLKFKTNNAAAHNMEIKKELYENK